MGNASSKESPTTSPHDLSSHHEAGYHPPRRPQRRKESQEPRGQSLSKVSTASPTTSVVESSYSALYSSSSNSSSHTRGRSQTLPNAQQTLQGIADDDNRQRLSSQASSTRETDPGSVTPNRSRSPRPPLHVETTSSPQAPDQPNAESSADTASTADSLHAYVPSSQFAHPPRLPLPIEEEIHAPDSPSTGTPSPGSPVIVPSDFKPSKEQQDGTANVDQNVPRSKSMLSSTTVDDDEEDVDEDVMYKAEDMKGPLVDTLLEWREGGSKVYVTGTFCGWVKKSRLHQHSNSKVFSAVIGLPPGTHHVTFFVDGVPRTARHLPTAVDYAASLVNYIEVPPPDTPQPVKIPEVNKQIGQQQQQQQQQQQRQKQQQQHQQHQQQETQEQHQHQQQQQQKHQATASPRSARPVPHGVHPPTTLPPPTPELKPSGAADHGQSGASIPSRSLSQKGRRATVANLTRKHEEKKNYHSEIPRFLLDYDATEDSSRAERAEAVMNTQPAPPTLPMFLTKSVLTTQTPMKDDASVLSYPNHTTLNHLMTCNIKDAVLAVSATTRYKSKFVTTITFRPVDNEDDDDDEEDGTSTYATPSQ